MDSLKASCCVVGAVLINLTLGTFYSVGNIIPYVASYMRKNGNPDVTAAHGSAITAAFLLGQGIFIIVGSFIEQNYGSRIACIFGCVIHCASTFLTIWAVNVNIVAVIMIYGFGSGLGCGPAYMGSIIAAQKWYPNYKGLFTGIVVAGFGFGGLLFTNLQTLYLNPKNLKAGANNYFGPEVYENVPNLFMFMGIIFTFFQSIGCLLAFPPPSPSVPRSAPSQKDDSNQGNTIIIEEPLPDMKDAFSAFKHNIFYIIGFMMMLVAPGVTFVNSLGKVYGQAYIDDDRYLATVVAVAAVANAIGRLTWGFLIDKFTFSTCYIIKVVLFATLISFFPFGFILSSQNLYLLWMLGLFFSFSGTFVLFPVFIEQVFGIKYHGMIYGVLYIALALSSILTSFVINVSIGPALSSTKSSNEKLYIRMAPCAIIAIGYCLSLAVFYFALPVRRLDNAIRRRKETETTKTRNTLSSRQDLNPVEKGTLAEKTSKCTEDALRKENSLGSIVRFNENPVPTSKEATLKRFAH